MRNWTNHTALKVARFLFFYRLVGVLAFELLQIRALLLVFPNAFEYFFIAYEAVRTRWDPARRSSRFWIVAAALIWVVIKLPQEYWIHVAQLDVTETLAEVGWAGPALAVAAVALLLVLWFLVRPRLDPVEWPWRIAADPLLASMGTSEQRLAWWSRHGAVRSLDTVEKVVLVGLISVIFGRVLPSLRTTDLQLFLGLAVLVVINVAWSLFLARRDVTLEAVWAVGLARLASNVALVFGADSLLGREGGDLNVVNTVFFLTLLSLIVVLHDRWRPIAATRFSDDHPLPGEPRDRTQG